MAAGAAGHTTSYRFSTGVTWADKWNCQDGSRAELGGWPGGATMSAEGAQMGGTGAGVAGFKVPADSTAGETWSEAVTVTGTVKSGARTAIFQVSSQVNCTAMGADSVTVPAGTFDADKAGCVRNVAVPALVQGRAMQVGANLENVTNGYAGGAGFVKPVATGGKNNEPGVLTGYEMP